ncbi:hypothetical protein O6U65_1852 [Saccharomyces cerevisiae synthetic construct]|uniref:Putative uncharacterized protein YLR286W-A n=1 Tax=Saccharomyces cerevisiae (strain ATCC 204508 / S288c) TaxID=559292 RepID=YL286_YEAST|nr:RecName: Full=Putative uncharacterized protein YLR286W-A [Saccharomyces cerevisiae S288C]AAL79279.1 unknown [Saccharomyces cerevisiae]WNV72990.1 hypothetical protein O6U65_1852 [Saccharomyces cerevisiae synthetic construct]
MITNGELPISRACNFTFSTGRFTVQFTSRILSIQFFSQCTSCTV